MEKIKINLLLPQYLSIKSKNKLLLVGQIVIVLSLFIFASLGFLTYQLIASKNGPQSSFAQNLAEELQIIVNFKHLILGSDKLLVGEQEDRINVLLLGIGGQGHEGPNLSDTIILTSIQPSVPKVALLSIPRDLAVPIPGFGWRKINDANALGETKGRSQGALLTKATVSQVFDLPIHYYIRVDFTGFKKIIDDLDGITLYVDRSFVDKSYPAGDNLYQTVSFQAGWQKMDGGTALKYVRSRHGTNGEGSDFARNLRQQKVLEALKNKVFSFSFLLNPNKILAVLEDLGGHIQTDLEPWQIIKLIKLVKDVKKENIISKVLDNGPEGPLYANTENGAYLLLPKAGDFSELQAMARGLLGTYQQVNSTVQTIKPEKILIEIQNGTKINGLAASFAKEIEKDNFNIIHLGNAQSQDYQQTIIYDLTSGQQIENLEKIKDLVKNKIGEINIFSLAINSPIISSLGLNKKADFVIILGQDAANSLANGD
jgi:LCP family protein required for cell wall assembly